MAVPQVILSQADFEMGTPVVITTNRTSGQSVTLRWYFAGTVGLIASGLGDAWTWDFPVSTLASVIPNTAVGSGYISAEYYNSEAPHEYLGHSLSPWFTATVPASVVPTIGWLTAVESAATAHLDAEVGLFVQGLSVVKCDFSGAAGVYGSTVISAKFTVDGVDHALFIAPGGHLDESTIVEYTQRVLAHSGTLTIKATVGDSRGRIGTMTLTPIVLPYAVPRITDFTAERCDSDGTLNDVGTSIKVTSGGSVSSLFNVSEKNQLNTTWSIYSRVAGTTDWGVPLKTTTNYGLTWTSTDIFGAHPITAAYEILLKSLDQYNTTLSILTVTTGIVTMSWSRNGVGVSKVWEQGALDVGGQIYQDGLAVIDTASLAAALPASEDATSSIVARADWGFTAQFRAWRNGKVVTCQVTLSGTPAFLAWESLPFAGMEQTVFRPTLQVQAANPDVSGFGVTVSANGWLAINCDGGAKSFPAGTYSFTLTWIIA